MINWCYYSNSNVKCLFINISPVWHFWGPSLFSTHWVNRTNHHIPLILTVYKGKSSDQNILVVNILSSWNWHYLLVYSIPFIGDEGANDIDSNWSMECSTVVRVKTLHISSPILAAKSPFFYKVNFNVQMGVSLKFFIWWYAFSWI